MTTVSTPSPASAPSSTAYSSAPHDPTHATHTASEHHQDQQVGAIRWRRSHSAWPIPVIGVAAESTGPVAGGVAWSVAGSGSLERGPEIPLARQGVDGGGERAQVDRARIRATQWSMSRAVRRGECPVNTAGGENPTIAAGEAG